MSVMLLGQALRGCLGTAQQQLGMGAVSGARTFATALDSKQVTVEVAPFKTHKIDGPSRTVTTNLGELAQLYNTMYKMRRMEVASDMQYKAKLIRGFCHLYDGQEAVLGGIEAALNQQDSIITSYRDHCHVLTRGGTVAQVMAELFGRATGATKGLGGSMHMYRRSNNFYGGNGIVGAQIPLGAGIAFAHRYKKEPQVCVAMYGDGAANQGQKYEALNMAGLWNLPVIFVCENNHYGMGTAEWRAAKSPSFYTRGDYIPGIKADGMDVLAVKQVVAYAKQHALTHGPIVLELDTYRYHGHSMSDPGSTYRTRDEINSMRQQRDPVERVKRLLTENGYPAEEIKKVEREVKKEVDEAVEAAKNAPLPPLDWMYRNIYVDPSNTDMRTVQGSYLTPTFDRSYKI
uniref:Pyruvate dehydrogenase E1 component subunit alpha n=1 Tax=Chlamydomonas leiostraca TaxID=1034604 RepID=A0A7S0WR05_9CHLO|mmetsp:Transcript_2429/g.6197  ORF Transcript_2429/g.6197 Transcript_2429/m.6197 type:complete len:402 (+) Transcript_2429:56-1261(+)|eukprot:CAMPEP_0202865490 /NCGR_PEP_ID=MMETSP1391-20130828/6180_1 /ASSEMBLY_ACC=CAM_ASM_000867 /TAXON_ID=1034604 /ORGANISM="Chlamydomonas leiostraca, Strain SAG 11-49" /LENGTH=401 /DNA_ID=CAMNT_0049545347 /DNA_START=53 /DNA_END=1258 /DNA_ORIENTATION=-